MTVLRPYSADNILRMKEILAWITYKPGWSFVIVAEPGIEPYLRTMVETTDPDTQRRVIVNVTRPLTPYLDPELFTYFLWEAINDLESHERLEWLRFHGEFVFDPHPEGMSVSSPWASKLHSALKAS